MKTFKAICATAVLVLALTISAHAGDGHSPVKSTTEPETYGTPTAAPEGSETTGATDSDLALLTFSNIMWALASIY